MSISTDFGNAQQWAQTHFDTFARTLRGRPRQPARAVVLQVSFNLTLALRAPQRPGGATGKEAPVPSGLVRVWEETDPNTGPGLEWLCAATSPSQTSPRPWSAPASTPAAG